MNFMTERTIDLIVVEKLLIIVNEKNLILLRNDEKMESVLDRDFQFQSKIIKVKVNK